MSYKRILNIPFILLLAYSFSGVAQEKNLGTEVVEIVKPYTPSVSDAFKIKETASLSDTVATQRKPVKYSIFSVPVASTFTPTKGKATEVERAKREKIYDNYATLGLGNYTTILAELYSNFEINKTDNFGFFFRHNSSQGDIKGVLLDNNYLDTRLDANYSSRKRDLSYRVDFGVEHQLYNWYGLPSQNDFYISPSVIDQIDPKQHYFSAYAGGNLSMTGYYFEKASINLRYLSDYYSSSEFNFTLKPEFVFPLTNVDLNIDADIDYLAGSFARNLSNTAKINYGYFNAGLAPSINFMSDNFSMSLGAAAYIGVDVENSESEFSMYPKINAAYRLDEGAIIYGGVDGGLKQNTYYDFKEENPYVSPTLTIAPTKTIYEGFAGIKGKATNSLAYNFRASFGRDENLPMFMANPLNAVVSEERGYQYGNSFQVVYDDVNTFSVFAEVQVALSDKFSLGANVNHFSYKTDIQDQAWNLPSLKASLFSNFNITEKLYGGADVFFVGERKDFFNANEVKLDSYVDANIHFGYRFNERLSAFVKGSNLFSDNYTKWIHYPVHGIQGLAGITYKFDW